MRLRTKILEGIKKIVPTAIGTKQCDILTNTIKSISHKPLKFNTRSVIFL